MTKKLPVNVKAKDVCEAFGGISRRTLHRWEDKDPDFPMPTYKEDGAATLWLREDILDYMELRKKKARENEQGANDAK